MTDTAPTSLHRRALLGAGLAAPSLLLAGTRAAHADQSLEAVRKRGALVTATEMQFAPWDMIENGKYVGVTRDQIDEVAKELGVKVEYNDLPWTGILPGLEAKRFDMCIAPVTATKERLKRYAFTIPIGASASMLMKRKGDTRLMKPEDMAGKIVGAQKGGIIVNNLKTYMEQAKITFQIREYQDNNQSYNDLASERIDVAASSQPNVAYAVTKRPEIFELVNPPFGPPTYLCWVARLGDDSLVNAVNAALMKMMDDGRMAAIQKKWFGTTMDLPKTLPEPVI